VYAGSFHGPIACLDAATGKEFWRRPLEAALGLAVGDERLYVSTAEGRVEALSREDGAPLWQTELDGGAATPPVAAGDTVVVGASEGSLFGLDARTGEVLGRYAPGPGLHAQPLVFEGGVLFLSDGGAVHILR
ncbi:MAG: PQQ-binding-like beta-propeller repeat protein, partial [Proteobacteria bacterium]|nr:PQQ-binding-like beta-propeller repeat protein [Pseudomonadota bacterium]